MAKKTGRPKFTLSGLEGEQYLQLIKNINSIIYERQIKKKEVAEGMGISASQLSRYLKEDQLEGILKGRARDEENPPVMLSTIHFLKLCKAIEVPAPELFIYHMKRQPKTIESRMKKLENDLKKLSKIMSQNKGK